MKKLLTLGALFVFGLFRNAQAQTTDFYIYGDSLYDCQTGLMILMATGAQADNGTITIDWGDGNIDNYPYTNSTPNATEFVQKLHVYGTPGNYTTHTEIFSNVTNANVGTGQDFDLYSPDQTTCGSAFASTHNPGSTVYYSDVVLDFEDANGNVLTISPIPNWSNMYTGLNPANAPYSVNINAAWLSLHGLTQLSATQTINSFSPSGMGTGVNGLEFIVDCEGTSNSVDVEMTYAFAQNFVAPAQSGYLYGSIINTSCPNNPVNVLVSVQFPAACTPVVAGLTNPSVTGNTLTFELTNVSFNQSFDVPFSFPGSTPVGTEFCFDIHISTPNEVILNNNATVACALVSNSYDPNEKQSNLPVKINPQTQDQLSYRIHFQNDGNMEAWDVKITDTLSENLDLTTFKFVSASHGVSVDLDPATRVVTFTFPGIMLAPSSSNLAASQGEVIYSIYEKAGLTEGDAIDNTAYIYFDFNPAIVTNTAHNINQSVLGLNGQTIEQPELYPNPAKDRIQFRGATINSVLIYDLTGKLAFETQSVLNNEISTNLLQDGIYQVVLTTEQGTSIHQLVIKK